MDTLTIIVPLYNSKSFLKPLLQRLNALEGTKCILIDDGSTDGTVNILKEVKCNKCSVIYNKHKGVSYARNIGIDMADTKYLTFVDSDDLVEVDILQSIVLNECNSEASDIISCGKNFCNRRLFSKDKFDLLSQILMLKENTDIIPAPFSKMYRTEFLKEKGIKFPTNVSAGEDMLFNVQAVAEGATVHALNKSFYRYRYNEQSVTHQLSYNIEQNRQNFLNNLERVLSQYVSDEHYNSLMQDKLILSWIQNSYKQISNDNSKLANEMRNYFLPKLKLRTIIHNRLPVSYKIFELLLIFKMYYVIGLIIHVFIKGEKEKVSFIEI